MGSIFRTSSHPFLSKILQKRKSGASQRPLNQPPSKFLARSAMAGRGPIRGWRKIQEGGPSSAWQGFRRRGLGGGLPRGRGFPVVPWEGCRGDRRGREARKSGFGPDFYFGPRGSLAPSDGAKHSAAIFLARVAGPTLPPTPARHPHQSPFFLRLRMGRRCCGRDRGSIPTQVFFGPESLPSSRPATIPDAYGHTTGNTPEPVRFQKLSLVRPS